jgi:hypothetical protein
MNKAKYFVIIGFFFACAEIYAQNLTYTYYYDRYIPYVNDMEELNQAGEMTIECTGLDGNILYIVTYYNREISDSTIFWYDSLDRLSGKVRYKKFYPRLMKTDSTAYIYNRQGKLEEKILYDYYRFQGFAGYERYYYSDTILYKIESFNYDSIQYQTRLYKRIIKNEIVDIRMDLFNNSMQINRSTYNNLNQLIKIEYNFSPKDTLDRTFPIFTEYSYNQNNLLERDGDLNYEYYYDARGNWIYKKIQKDSIPVSCIYRKK